MLLKKKAVGIISSQKEHEDFEEWKAEQAEERKEKPKRQVKIKAKMPEQG